MYKYLLFDADNTLLDFNKGERCALEEVLTDSPLEFNDEVFQIYHKINDNLWKLLEDGKIERKRLRTYRFELLFDHFCVDGTQFCKDVDDKFLLAMSHQAYVFDGVYEVLEKLSAKYELYLVTNASLAVQRKRLSQTKFDRYIKKYYISEEVGYHKPQKEFFDAVLNDIGDTNRENYLVIGDSLSSDIRGAVNSNIDSCFCNFDNMDIIDLEPTYVINNIYDLLEIL